MHTLKVLSILFALIFYISMLYGCGSDENKGDLSMRYFLVTNETQPEPTPEPQPETSSISLSVDKLDLEHFAGTTTIQIKADCAWRIFFGESSDTKDIKDVKTIDWINAEPSSGTGDCEVTLTFEDNRILFEDRTCELFVISESGTALTASIKQEGVTYYNAKEGDKITFGRWPQSYYAAANFRGSLDDFSCSNYDEVFEPLTWVVDSKNNQELYLTTENSISFLHRNNRGLPDSFTISWINDQLCAVYIQGFNDEERSMMGYFYDNPDLPVSLFTPSVPYFQTAESRRCGVTDAMHYWYFSGSRPDYFEYVCDYPDSNSARNYCLINSDGDIVSAPTSYNYSTWGLRPRIKLNFNK